ncbi:MAG: PASTA domain-containing protein [Clostridia bacterium]|nr:PASTA domain-containing protein [Clostridia bacterium]
MQAKINKRLPERSLIVLIIFMVLFALLIIRLFYLQVIKYDDYQAKVISDVQRETTVNAERGVIYDSNMVALATNTTTWRVFISPRDIKEQSQENLIASELARILDVDEKMIHERAARTNRADEIIKKNIDEETYDLVMDFIEKNNLYNQIHLEASTKRYYPYGSLAANVLGFVGTDGGLIGLEYQYDDQLTGVEGKYITAKDAGGKNMPFKYDSYIEAENGGNLVTTLNTKVQAVLEEQLKATYNDSDPLSRVCGIVMDTETGAVLGMATYPTMDLNDPFTLDEDSQKKLEESGFAEGSEDYEKLYWTLINEMWKNKAVSELYEPGSTFKVITIAEALEEGVTNFSERYYCSGELKIEGYARPIPCHKVGGHGSVSLAEGLQQSCNPTLMEVAAKLGRQTFYDYFYRFGYAERTGIDLPGEERPIFSTFNNFHQVELAVYSFGQTFKVTPVQQIRAICSIANGGYLVTPHLVDRIIDDDGNVLWSFENEKVRQVVSSDVCAEISDVLEKGVAGNGGAKNTYVPGYKIAAKTGTSQKRDILDEDYVVGSTVAYAPSDNPKVACLIMVDTPTCQNQYGSVVAAPYVAKVMEEVLPLLGVERHYSEKDIGLITTAVSNYTGKSIDVVKEALDEKKLSYEIIGDGETVVTQLPAPGSSLMLKTGKVVLYTAKETPENNLVTVPDLIGSKAESANSRLVSEGFNVGISGSFSDSAVVTAQSPAAGEAVPKGTIITITVRSMNGTE